jgi:uncharacterized repeat protein (TIGR01451 family)
LPFGFCIRCGNPAAFPFLSARFLTESSIKLKFQALCYDISSENLKLFRNGIRLKTCQLPSILPSRPNQIPRMQLRAFLTAALFSLLVVTGFSQQIDWLKQAEGYPNSTGNGSTSIYGFHRDDAGNLYTEMPITWWWSNLPLNLFGTLVNAPTANHKYKVLGKFDSNMNLIWAVPFRSNPGVYLVNVREIITVDKAGSVYYLDQDTTFKFTSNGKMVWKKPFSGFDIRTNKQGLLDIYRFKNSTNTLNGTPILNNLGSVVTFDTAGNYVHHFTLQNSAYQSQIVFGKNNTGYYGIRVSARPPGYNGPVRHEFFTCDSLGTILNTGRFNYNYYYNGGPTSNSGLIQTAYDPDRQEYYMVAFHRIVNPINKPDSTAGKPQQFSIIKLNANLQVTGFLPLGPLKPTGLGWYPFYMRAHKGNLFFSSKTEWTTVSYYTHFGLLNPHGIGNDRIVVGKLDRNLNLSWFMHLGDGSIEHPIPTDNGIYFCGTSRDFSNKHLNFNALGFTDAFIVKVADNDSTTAELSGKIYNDLNQNGVDDNEPGIPGQSISNNTGGAIAYSAGNGFYQTAAVTGLNTLRSNTLPKYWVRTTPDSLQISVPATAAHLIGYNFGMRAIPGVKDAYVSLTPMTAARINMQVMYQLTYRNLATDALNGSVKMVKAPELIYQNATITPNVISGDTLIWNYTNLAPQENRQIQVKFTLPNNPALNNKYLATEAGITPLAGDTVQENNTDYLYHQITGPRDPNDIMVTPSCPIDRPFITAGKFLEYRIRFQNIGTDTAFSVVIHDTLSNLLDLSTLEFVNQSHNARFWLKDNVLTVFFENIKLPRIGVNYLGSHGFFTYRVKVKPNTPVGASIKNKAAIYFDYNAPVNTNQVNTSVIPSIPPFTAARQHLNCYGAGNGQITVNNPCLEVPVTYSLDSLTFQDSPVFSQLAAGNYTVWIRAGKQYFKLDSLQLQQPDSISATITLQHATSGNGQIQVTITGGTGPYQYSLNGVPYQGQSNLAAGTYLVTIRDQNNCVKTYTVTIQNISGLENDKNTGIKIYPNPFSGQLQLETELLSGEMQAQVFNALGQLVHSQEINTRQTTLELHAIPAGVYLIKVTTSNGYTVHKIVKE